MTGIWRIEWKPSAQKELKRIDRQDISRILAAVESLRSNPFPAEVRKIQGSEHSFRIRVGNYRIIYSVFEKRLCIEIVRVRHRKDVYRISS